MMPPTRANISFELEKWAIFLSLFCFYLFFDNWNLFYSEKQRAVPPPKHTHDSKCHHQLLHTFASFSAIIIVVFRHFCYCFQQQRGSNYFANFVCSCFSDCVSKTQVRVGLLDAIKLNVVVIGTHADSEHSNN